MKKSAILAVSILGLVGALAAVPASAGPVVLYDNATVLSGTYDAWPINQGFSVSDSFTLSSSSTVGGADFNVWLSPGDTLSSVFFSIGTEPLYLGGGTNEEEGTAYPTARFIEVNSDGYDIDEESFSINSLPLVAGTYWFSLQNAVAVSGNPLIYWDMSNGPSVAYVSTHGNTNGYAGVVGTNSDTFQILGTSAAVTPEPSSFLLLGSGLLGLAGLIKRKLMA